jgi:hypothetical protein
VCLNLSYNKTGLAISVVPENVQLKDICEAGINENDLQVMTGSHRGVVTEIAGGSQLFRFLETLDVQLCCSPITFRK